MRLSSASLLFWAHKGNIALNVMTASKSILRMMFGFDFPSNRRKCGWREISKNSYFTSLYFISFAIPPIGSSKALGNSTIVPVDKSNVLIM